MTTDAGPFEVEAPTGGEAWNGPGPHEVRWDVAGTDAPPVSCSAVDISLSTDGGWTYDIPLASRVLNNGSYTMMVNAPDTTDARVRVACSNHAFFNISSGSFQVSDAVTDQIFADGFESGAADRWSEPNPGE